MVSADKAKPLFITPILEVKPQEPEIGRYEILQRLVTASPIQDNAEIETALEVFFGPNEAPLWRRVVVRSGPVCPEPEVMASMQLPDSDDESAPLGNALCWTAFSDQPDHPILCILASPTLLCLWDVYPSLERISAVGDGVKIPLPFEACSIHAMVGSSPPGLMLQRLETMEDHLDAKPWQEEDIPEQEDDEGFVLGPPRPVRTSIDTLPQTQHSQPASSAVPSLFSLTHPWEDILPVSDVTNCLGGATNNAATPEIVSDVFEKVLFVGALTGVEPEEDDRNRTAFRHSICVTYHTQKKRHSIWEIQEAPAPPPPTPLWKVTRHWRSDQGWNDHIRVLEQDLEDLELFGEKAGSGDTDKSHYDTTTTRNDALADALGIRRTPRKAAVDESNMPRSRGARSTTRGQARQSLSNTGAAANNNHNNISLISPVARQMNATHDNGHTMLAEGETMSLDENGRPPLLTMGPFSSLYPKVSIQRLYQDKKQSAEAGRIFVASNMEGSGRMTLCLLCPADDNHNTLRMFTYQRHGELGEPITENESHSLLAQKFSIAPEVCIPCISAIPVETSPVAPLFHSRKKEEWWKEMAVDILVLRDDGGPGKLTLFRNSLPVIDCAVASNEGVYDETADLTIYDIQNGVDGYFDLVVKPSTGQFRTIRSNISLSILDSEVAENILSNIECSIFSISELSLAKKAEFAMKFRSDCVRLTNLLDTKLNEDDGPDAVGAVVIAMFQFGIEYLNINDDNNNCNNKYITNQTKEPKSAWERLLQTKYHIQYEMMTRDYLFETPIEPIEPQTEYHASQLLKSLSGIFSSAVDFLKGNSVQLFRPMLLSLHELYEEFKLDGTYREVGLPALGTILASLCRVAGSGDSSPYMLHYKRDLGERWYQRLGLPATDSKCAEFEESCPPFCVLSWVDEMVAAEKYQGSAQPTATTISPTCKGLRSLMRIFSCLYDTNSDRDSNSRDFEVANLILEEGYTDVWSIRDCLPVGIALPLLEVLHRCRSTRQEDRVIIKDPRIWSLVGRDDLRKNAELDNGAKLTTCDEEESQNYDEDNDKDGLFPLEKRSAMLFPEDNRIREVGRLLRSSRPVCLKVHRAIEISDHDYERLKQEKLMLLSRRILALPLGRGMMTVGNLKPIPAEPLPIPKMCLVGRVPPTNAMLALDTTECPADMKMWPDFANGAAAGLRIPLEKDVDGIVSRITRTWIVYNRHASQPEQNQNASNATQETQEDLGHAYGGVLMALGLRGYLTALEMTDIFDYLTEGSVTTTVGVLLGMAANMRGTCDMSVSKMLCLHIPSLIPQHFSSIDVASCVQAAAVSGAGLLYQASSHRMMTEFLLNEIGKRPSTDGNVVDREAYILSCGIALGMVNLSKGEGDDHGIRNAGLADLNIEERLYRYIVGGSDDAEIRRKREESDRLSLPTTSASGFAEKCSCIYEGDLINTDVTSPGATLALGLIYMKSGNKSIASTLSLPDTHFLLEYVRPDFLMLRVIAKSLVVWNDVQPSSEWIESQLPAAVKEAYEIMRAQAEYIAGQRPSVPSSGKEFDRQAVRLMYTHVIAGACFSLGLRFAGTGNRDAAAAIFERVLEFKDLRDGADAVACALRPHSPVLEMCLGCAAVSLSMVLAGTGDLEALTLLKVLRWRCDEEINYGSHLAFGASIGLLFLGGGTCTLGREPEDIAALLLAFYPRLPSSTSDNQYHLQALRNLYALAVKRRDVKAIDVDTNESVFVPVQVTFESSSVPPAALKAPCLLRNYNATPKTIRVASNRYYPVAVNFKENSSGHTLFVKRRSAHLNYKQDPDAKRSLLVQSGCDQGVDQMDLVESFTSDRIILSFAKHFCGIGHAKLGSISLVDPSSMEAFLRRVLFESLILDTQEALPLFLALRSAVECADFKSNASVALAWDFRLVKSYYNHRRRLVDDSMPRLLSAEYVAYLHELFEIKMHSVTRGKGDAGIGPTTCSSSSVLYDHPLVPIDTTSGNLMDVS